MHVTVSLHYIMRALKRRFLLHDHLAHIGRYFSVRLKRKIVGFQRGIFSKLSERQH